MKPGDKVWLLMARVEEYPSDEVGAIDPNSFEWVPAVIDEVADGGSLIGEEPMSHPGAWLRFPTRGNESAWYDDRYIMTESAAKTVRLPENF
jgi:hypothetical protein